jgi:hypothetical protein
MDQRQKRMLRWSMRFNTNSGSEYLAQLRGLGAILAFPVGDPAKPDYEVVRDLRPGGRFLKEDLTKIQRIYWIDENLNSVRGVLQALGQPLRTPTRMVVFLPEELEKQLYDMERSCVENVLKSPFDENRVNETHFRVLATPGGFKPQIVRVTLR